MADQNEPRPWLIDGYPVSHQEVLDQATMISGRSVYSMATARRILWEEGRDLTMAKCAQ